jgi:hypothetical protein
LENTEFEVISAFSEALGTLKSNIKVEKDFFHLKIMISWLVI